MKKWVLMLVMIGCLSLFVAFGIAFSQAAKAPPEKTSELLAMGKKLYEQNCSPCHAPGGDGKGPLGTVLKPPPRDFNLPFDQWTHAKGDVKKGFDVIDNGIPNTAMFKG